MVGALLTAVPGSSDAFMGGIIAYDNDVKRELLGVRGEHLALYGAVSEPVALEMESGVRKLLHAEVGVSVTGIAGPGGATQDKPVGTVWIACNGTAKQFFMKGDRAEIRQQATHAALDMAQQAVLQM
jgi:PncC family amidohydrolase